MIMKLRKAQSTAEYAVLFGLVVGAVLAMQTYVKRSLQAKIADSGDYLTRVSGDPAGIGQQIGTRKQYEPYYLAQQVSNTSKSQTKSTTQNFSDDGAVTKTLTVSATQDRDLKENTYTEVEEER